MNNFFYDLNKRMATLASKQDAKQISEDVKAVASKSKLAESISVAEAGYSAKAGRAGKDLGKPGKNFAKIAKGAAERYGSKAAGERVAGAVLNKLRHPKESTCMADEGNAFSGAVAKAKADGIHPGEKINVGGKTYPVKETGPMTPKQKSFAKLAPPADKITFADKIAGAKKEVDEMLGDVAAEAMKAAVGKGKQTVTDEGDVEDFVKAGGKITYGKPQKGPRHPGLSLASKHIGGGGDKMKPSRSGRGANTQGKPVVAVEDEMDEGYAEMDAWLKDREKEKGTGRFDKRKVSTGTVYTRKPETFAGDDEEVSTEPKRRGRPMGKDKGPERVTAKSYKYKSGRPTKTAEDLDSDGVMMTKPTNCSSESVGDNNKSALKAAIALLRKAGYKVSKAEKELDEFFDQQVTVKGGDARTAGGDTRSGVSGVSSTGGSSGASNSNKNSATGGSANSSSKANANANANANADATNEETLDKEDQRAERAGKKVSKDIEYDEGHKGKDDNKAEKAGKKVTKDIEYDDKKDKEEKVKESSKGGYNFGGSVYEGFNNKVETMIAEGIEVVANENMFDGNEESITIVATGPEVHALKELLKMAGLGAQADATCDSCGHSPCGCEEEMVDENSPDWPTNTETSPDALQYSGGLNGPKSTGQTTIPVIASQVRRQSTMEENVELERSLFKLYKDISGK